MNRPKKRYKLRKSTIAIIVILFVLITVAMFQLPFVRENVFINKAFNISPVSKNVKKALEIQMPDWIQKDIIHIHNTARTGRQLKDINSVVIHYVGNPSSTAKANRDYFDKPTTTVSSHFIVGLEGEIIQCVPIYEWSAASNNRNGDTISIEVCHPDQSGRFNEATYNSLVKLTAWICNNFSLDESDIIRHYDVTGKICPKYYVENEDEWLLFKKRVKEKL